MASQYPPPPRTNYPQKKSTSASAAASAGSSVSPPAASASSAAAAVATSSSSSSASPADRSTTTPSSSSTKASSPPTRPAEHRQPKFVMASSFSITLLPDFHPSRSPRHSPRLSSRISPRHSSQSCSRPIRQSSLSSPAPCPVVVVVPPPPASSPRSPVPSAVPSSAASPSCSRQASNTSRPSPAAQGPTVLTFALKHRPRATRASVPKVRTGCRTCKKRHVKCDEAKPSCGRCLKWKGFCEGYEADASPVAGSSSTLPDRSASSKKQQYRGATASSASSASSSASPPGTTAPSSGNRIVPKIEPRSEETASDGSPPVSSENRLVVIKQEDSDVEDINRSSVLLEPNFNSVMFSYDWEKTYFDRWLILAQNLGGGWFPSNLWTRTIPQLSRGDPAVRFAAIAVGAMAQAMSPALLGKSYHHMLTAGSVVPHYRNALTYYGHALRLLRLKGEQEQERALVDSDRNDSGDNLRSAVLSCLLFVCFEALQGNREGALQHITHGLQIVDQFVARTVKVLPEVVRGQEGGQGGPSGQCDQGFEQQQQQLARRREWDRNLGLAADPQVSLAKLLTKSPAPYVLEDEVMQVFRRLDFQAWSLGVFRLRRTRPADIKFQALDALNPASIPSSFDNLEDARRWWDLVQHWVLQFPRYMVASLQRYMDANPDAAARAQASGRMLDICDVPHVREIQKDYLHCLESWHAAFWPLYDTARRQRFRGAHSYGGGGHTGSGAGGYTLDESEYLRAISLQIQYLLAWVGVRSLVYSDYEAMYQLTPQLKELNRLAAILLPRQPQRPFLGSSDNSGELFTMDNGPTMALFIVSCKCRREDVREESIRLLEQYPRRDGFWDSKVLGAIARWNQELEAENEKEGDLYEQWLRLRQREAIFDETNPQVKMTALVKDPNTGEYVKVSQIVKWDR